MAIDIKFDLTNNPEPPTIILATRNGQKLGQLDVDEKSIELVDKFNDASEISFTLNKYIDGELTNLWDKVVDFKLVYCKEWDMWFEIKVELDEATETVKTVFCTQLGQAELSQIMLHNIEINTEEDIERDDYKISILYDKNDPEASILDRTLEKAPHYHIAHVDSTIAKIQRSFSFDGTSIYDAHQEIAEEIGCLFEYPSNSDENGKINRAINVYDLQQNCNDCGHRGEFTDICPKCGSTNIKYGYGEDTLIFVTADELASKGISLETDTDSVKNCFKLEAGDDLMTATVRNCNPNGTDYIWRFSDIIKDDMSDELVEKIESYNDSYKYYYDEKVSDLDAKLVNDYNNIVNKYSAYNKDLQTIATPVKGYSALMNAYYNTIDFELYLKSSLMPSIEMSKTNAKEQASLLTASSLSPVAVANIKTASSATANSAVLAIAKIIVKSTYKVEINTSEMTNNGDGDEIWTGSFIVTNYSDEEDMAISNTVSVTVNGDEESFIKQKIEKALNKENTDDYSITGLFEKEYDDFCAELKKYALNPLTSFHDACQTCIDILIEQGVADGNTWSDPESGSDGNLYEKLYLPYYNKLMAIEAEIQIRENELNTITGVHSVDGELLVDGLQTNIEKCRNQIQDFLNFEEYLGKDLWNEFCSYRREDTYSNENYISDGLNNAELFEKALEFIEVAENEIYKASELQCSISTSLNNLLAIPKFKPLVDSFKNGNWIRVRIDDEIYKLRMIQYEIGFNNFENIPVEFSNVTKIKNGITDVESILSQASSMATSYDSVKRQSKQGDKAQDTIEQWFTSGLNSALVQIQSNDSEDISLTKNGLLCRSYDDITETYSPEQFKLTHNIMAYTTDNWKTVSAALGKHEYEYYDSNKILSKGVDYGLTSKFVTAGYINGSQIIGGEIYSQNYTSNSGTYMNLNDGTFSWAGGKIKFDGNDVIFRGVDLTWFDIDDAPTKLSQFENDTDYQNSIQVTQITKDTVTAPFIKTLNLSVGNEIKMGDNATISWSNVTGTSDVATKTYVTNQGYQNASQVTTITKNTITTSYINALKITAGSVSAENITGTTISGKTISGGSVSGSTITGGSINIGNGNFVVDSNGKMTAKSGTFSGSLSAATGTFKGTLSAVDGSFTKLTAGKSSFATNQIIIDASYKDGNGEEVSKGSIYIGRSGVSGWEDITIRPSSNNLGNIGTENHSWDIAYIGKGVIQTSDRNYKKDISEMGEKQERFFDLLTPVTYKFIDNTNDRVHYGFISQDVEDAIIKSGLTTKDFSGFIKSIKKDDNGNFVLDENGNQTYSYALRYGEFIALNTYMIQKLKAENKELKKRILSLESKLV